MQMASYGMHKWLEVRGVVLRSLGRSVAPLKLVVLKWQVEHSPASTCGVPSALSTGRTLVLGVPAQLIPASWQLEQAADPTALCTIPGAAVPLTRSEERRVGKAGRSRWSQDH